MRLAAVVLGLLALLPGSAVAAEAEACTDTANVTWETNFEDVTVTGAVVEVPGCDDGKEVGLQLLTPDGDVPDEPLRAFVEDEHARFDLAPLNMRIEPVIGVRVLLYGEQVIEFFEITVDQRYFNQPRNEQRGLREITVLSVRDGGYYRVPGAPSGYVVEPCDELLAEMPDDVIEEGAGEAFQATQSGRHLVCYLQVPGPRPPADGDEGPGTGAPGDDVPGVVEPPDETGVSDDSDVQDGVVGDDDFGEQPDDPSGVLGSLAFTGTDLALALGVAILLVVSGAGLRRFGRRQG